MQADKDKINRLLKTARGQIDGILKMIEEDRYCIDVSTQISSTQAILKKANQEVIAAHMSHCVHTAIQDGNSDEKIEELTLLIQKLIK